MMLKISRETRGFSGSVDSDTYMEFVNDKNTFHIVKRDTFIEILFFHSLSFYSSSRS